MTKVMTADAVAAMWLGRSIAAPPARHIQRGKSSAANPGPEQNRPYWGRPFTSNPVSGLSVKSARNALSICQCAKRTLGPRMTTNATAIAQVAAIKGQLW